MEVNQLYKFHTGDFYVEPHMLNHLDILHGGELARHCDSAIGMLASSYADSRVLTVAIKEFNFQKITHVNDHISFSVTLLATSAKTMTYYVEILLENLDQPVEKVGTGIFIFVAVDEQLKSTQVPAFEPVDVEQQQFVTQIRQQFHI